MATETKALAEKLRAPAVRGKETGDGGALDLPLTIDVDLSDGRQLRLALWLESGDGKSDGGGNGSDGKEQGDGK